MPMACILISAQTIKSTDGEGLKDKIMVESDQ